MMDEPPTRPSWARPLTFLGEDAVIDALVQLFLRGDQIAQVRLGEGTEVIVVLVSRRLSCIYEVLVAEGFDGFAGCTVVSDRALQGSVRVEPGVHVIVIDDAVILGTTLVDTYDELVGSLDDDRTAVTALVALVDDDRNNPAFVEHLDLERYATDGFPLRMRKQELEDVAERIAQSLYRAGRPYFTDFPLLRSVSVPRQTWDRLCADEGWMAFDVTAPIAFGGQGQRAISFFPAAATLESIVGRVHPSAASLLDAAKVRVYLRDGDDGEVELRLVPMGLPVPVMPERLIECLEAIGSRVPTGLPWRTWKPAAQHRLLQMYLSTCVLAEFWRAIGSDVPVLTSGQLDRVHVQTYFGADDTPAILDAFDHTVRSYREAAGDGAPHLSAALGARAGLADEANVRRWTLSSARMVTAARELADRMRLAPAIPPEPTPGRVTEVDGFWVQRVLLVFGTIDHELERPQEQEIQRWPYRQYRAWRRKQAAGHQQQRYIKLGLTLSELVEAFSSFDAEVTSWSRCALSLAIDIGNDLGIVVPTTVHRPDGPVFRQYRSGEMAYAVNTPHQDVVADLSPVMTRPEDLDAVVDRVDRFTHMLLEDRATTGRRDLRDVSADFVRDAWILTDQARHPNDLAQVWLCEVTELSGDEFVVAAESQIEKGESTTAQLASRYLGDEASLLAVGDTVVWTIFEPEDPTGRIQPGFELRRVAVTAD